MTAPVIASTHGPLVVTLYVVGARVQPTDDTHSAGHRDYVSGEVQVGVTDGDSQN